MRVRRGLDDPRLLCAGPGRLCQALGVTREHDGLPLDRPPFELYRGLGRVDIVSGPRIGIRAAAELPWRYGLAGSRFVSRGFGLRTARRSA
jgi:DNA-3-methyladenine glycosylase